jgi:5-methylcytosine-specific restriction endonuclease McrA
MSSVYSTFSEEKKARIRRSALAYYHRNRDPISVRRKHERDTNPEFKIKRKQRETRYTASRRNYHLKKYYGITLSDQDKMYRSQNGKCAICLRRFDDIHGGKNTMHIDHNHTTGEVRQLLCGPCNCAIGNLNEDIPTVRNVLKYLKKWN